MEAKDNTIDDDDAKHIFPYGIRTTDITTGKTTTRSGYADDRDEAFNRPPVIWKIDADWFDRMKIPYDKARVQTKDTSPLELAMIVDAVVINEKSFNNFAVAFSVPFTQPLESFEVFKTLPLLKMEVEDSTTGKPKEYIFAGRRRQEDVDDDLPIRIETFQYFRMLVRYPDIFPKHLRVVTMDRVDPEQPNRFKKEDIDVIIKEWNAKWDEHLNAKK